MYLTYIEYMEYGGTLDEATFDDFEMTAEMYINYYTFDRLVNDTVIPERVKRLTYKLIELVQKKSDSMTLGMSAESNHLPNITKQENDGVSVSYNGMSSASMFQTCSTEITKMCNNYLSGAVNEAGRKLLFKGLYPGE